MVPSLPLLSCELPVSVKKILLEKKPDQTVVMVYKVNCIFDEIFKIYTRREKVVLQSL